MRLRNKKTGEIKEVIVDGYPVSGKTELLECSEMDANEETGYKTLGRYNSLAELNSEWEDYEEPKEYWCIDWTGGVNHITVLDGFDEYEENKKEIGNYFETKEEAEKAVEKLKAWKRLKDKGVKFNLDFVKNSINFTYRIDGTLHSAVDEERIIFEDMKLLFGGEDVSK